MTRNKIEVYPVDNESFTPADFQINVDTETSIGETLASVSLYLSEADARFLMTKLIAYLD